MAEHYDIAIVGAGPAGALTACLCAGRGAAVLLVDKARFPRAKVCGGCLGGEAMAVLERAGLATLPAQCQARPVEAFRLATAGRTATLPLAGGHAVSRRRFDQALVQAAVRAGAEFHDGTAATLTAAAHGPHAHRLTLHHRDGAVGAQRAVHARGLVVADGLAGTCLAGQADYAWQVARRARVGVGTVLADGAGAYEPGVIHMAVGARGYVGVVAVEDGQLDIAAAVDASALQAAGGPAAFVARQLGEAGLPAIAGLAEARWRGTPWLTRWRRRVAGPGLFVVGDAAGYVEPFTGEGIGWGLCSAEAVAPLALEAIAAPAAARQWGPRHRHLFAARHRRCRAVAALLRRPTLMRLSTALLARRPALAQPITRRLALGI